MDRHCTLVTLDDRPIPIIPGLLSNPHKRGMSEQDRLITPFYQGGISARWNSSTEPLEIATRPFAEYLMCRSDGGRAMGFAGQPLLHSTSRSATQLDEDWELIIDGKHGVRAGLLHGLARWGIEYSELPASLTGDVL